MHRVDPRKYDRFEFSLGNAYGTSSYKIALNPMMVMCYHPHCLEKSKGSLPAVKLKHPFHLQTYLNHLLDHFDDIGEAMRIPVRIRFSAVNEDCFLSSKSLDALSMSPYLMQSTIALNQKAVKIIEDYAIDRQLSGNYVSQLEGQIDQQRVSQLSRRRGVCELCIELSAPHPRP